MLSRVIIKNFKSIGEAGVDLELKPLTILVGPNGGGKSSVIEAVLLAWHGGGGEEHFVYPPWLDQRLSADSLIHKRKHDATIFVGVIFREESDPATEASFTYSRGLSGQQYDFNVLPAGGEGLEAPLGAANASGVTHRDINLRRNRVYFLSGSRGKPSVREQKRDDVFSVGIQGDTLLAYLEKIFGSNEYNCQAAPVARWAEKFGMSSLKAGSRTEFGGDTGAGADYVDPDLRVVLPSALASTGARQVLAVITQVFASPRGSLIMIEEPEISLHPESQVKLVEMFAEAIRDGKQVIITTHSHYLLLALTDAIQRELLKSEDVAVYEVKKEKETGTAVKALPVTRDGVIKGWVSSFAKVDSQLLRMVFKKRSASGR